MKGNRIAELVQELTEAIRNEEREKLRGELASLLGGGRKVAAEKPRRVRAAPAAPAKRIQGQRTCKGCGSTAHDRRTCPKAKKGDDEEHPAELDLEVDADRDKVPAWKPPRRTKGARLPDVAAPHKGPRHPHAAQSRAAQAAAERARLERYDGKRELVRCTECGVKVLRLEREMRGHLKRAHGYVDTECYEQCFEAPSSGEADAA